MQVSDCLWILPSPACARRACPLPGQGGGEAGRGGLADSPALSDAERGQPMYNRSLRSLCARRRLLSSAPLRFAWCLGMTDKANRRSSSLAGALEWRRVARDRRRGAACEGTLGRGAKTAHERREDRRERQDEQNRLRGQRLHGRENSEHLNRRRVIDEGRA